MSEKEKLYSYNEGGIKVDVYKPVDSRGELSVSSSSKITNYVSRAGAGNKKRVSRVSLIDERTGETLKKFNKKPTQGQIYKKLEKAFGYAQYAIRHKKGTDAQRKLLEDILSRRKFSKYLTKSEVFKIFNICKSI